MKKTKKKFLKLPEYPGGKEAFRNYIKSNLVYPEEAKRNRIEGTVHLNAEIDDNGIVLDVAIEKSLGYGCDEEALRLIKAVQFGKVKNRGLRVKTHRRFRIEFRLPPQNKVSYNLVKNPKKNSKDDNTDSYSYTIKL